MKQKILIIEDDFEICSLLKEYLEANGYIIETANNGLKGLSKIKCGEVDLIILDLMLPYKSGDEILREMREFSNIPVIILSAKDTICSKVDLLRLGADDYITKPFDLNEVLARVQCNLRRVNLSCNDSKKILKFKDIVLFEEEKKVTVKDIIITLTSKEYGILKLLLSNQNKVFSKANLFESIWKEEYFSEDNTLNVHISNIRNKLKSINPDEEYIETIWGMGYKLHI